MGYRLLSGRTAELISTRQPPTTKSVDIQAGRQQFDSLYTSSSIHMPQVTTYIDCTSRVAVASAVTNTIVAIRSLVCLCHVSAHGERSHTCNNLSSENVLHTAGVQLASSDWSCQSAKFILAVHADSDSYVLDRIKQTSVIKPVTDVSSSVRSLDQSPPSSESPLHGATGRADCRMSMLQ